MAFKPVTIADFKGLGTRWAPEKVPPGMCIVARNVRFVGESIGPRPGLSIALIAPMLFGDVPTPGEECPDQSGAERTYFLSVAE